MIFSTPLLFIVFLIVGNSIVQAKLGHSQFTTMGTTNH